MLQASKRHLADVGESYFEHMRFALLVGTLAMGAGLACILHAIIPAMCERSCSRAIASLQRLFVDRSRTEEVIAENSALLIFVVLTAISLITCVAVTVCTAGSWLALVVIPQSFTLPIVFLSQNRGLDPATA
jgi:hypothetical protein